MEIVNIYYGALKSIAPDLVTWYSSNTEYIAVCCGLYAIASLFVILFGIRRNKRKGGDS